MVEPEARVEAAAESAPETPLLLTERVASLPPEAAKDGEAAKKDEAANEDEKALLPA